MRTVFRASAVLAVAVAAAASIVHGQNNAAPAASAGDWPGYRRDAAGTGYSALDQITAANVSTLKPGWTYNLAAAAAPAVGRGGAQGANSQVTPIVVRGVMYLPASDRVVALDPAT